MYAAWNERPSGSGAGPARADSDTCGGPRAPGPIVAFLLDSGHDKPMQQTADLLTTGQAAALLGCSRQLVVDLCERGELRSTSIGSHRRLRRGDVDTYARRRTRGSLTPDQLRSLWLHRAVAGQVAAAPGPALELARENARFLLDRGPPPRGGRPGPRGSALPPPPPHPP